MVWNRGLGGWTALFFVTTVATSVTGFGFPFDHLLPSHKGGHPLPRGARDHIVRALRNEEAGRLAADLRDRRLVGVKRFRA